MHITYVLAFTTGVLSFLAPCVLPLLPAYIGMIAGMSFSELQSNELTSKYRIRILINSLFFVVGFTLVFTLLGLSASGIGQFININREVLSKVGGVLIIFFGLFTIGLFKHITFFYKESRITVPENWKNLKYIGPFAMGITFALAWTPCVGAILGAILTLAATTQGLTGGAILLFTYSLGISIPFVIIALTMSTTYPLIKKLGPQLHYIQKIGGVLLIITGVLLYTGHFTYATKYFLTLFGNSSYYQSLIEML